MNPAALNGKRALVTGASGFLASNMIKRLSALDCEIVQIAREDLGERESWDRVLPGLDAVFHFAAQTSVYEAERDPEADWRANVLPMRTLLDACADSPFRPFIVFAGSATQCGLTEKRRVDELLPDLPVTVYDRHKLEAEQLLRGSSASRSGARLHAAVSPMCMVPARRAAARIEAFLIA